jgi:crossover junction endodeoxyribonuclease RuvC
MKVIGIDPGTKITGYGIVELVGTKLIAIDYGCIRTNSKDPSSKRYLTIFNGINELIEKFKPDCLSIETQYVQKNVQSAIKLGMARGVATVAAAGKDIPVFEYSPTKAKSSVVGSGRASKQQVQNMTKALLNLSEIPRPEDAADALALAICHINNSGVPQ